METEATRTRRAWEFGKAIFWGTVVLLTVAAVYFIAINSFQRGQLIDNINSNTRALNTALQESAKNSAKSNAAVEYVIQAEAAVCAKTGAQCPPPPK